MTELTHVDAQGRPTMVDVSAKAITLRTAVAESRVQFPAAVARTLRVEALWSDAELRFRLLDRGSPFDPATAKPPRFDGSVDGGFGVYIIREIMDVFDYTRGDGGSNVLELVKRIPGKEGAR